MTFRFAAVVAASLVALVLGAGPGSANDLAAGAAAPATSAVTTAPTYEYESGFVTTQRRGRGNFNRGGGRRHNNTGRNVAIGVGAAVLGGIIASQAASASGGGNCRRWSYQCNRGVGSSCRNLNRYC